MTQPGNGNIEQTVYVRNINYDTESATIGVEFGKFGPVAGVRIISIFNGREQVSAGYGFVEFKTAEGCRAAREAPDPVIVDGRRLTIYPARPPRPRKRDTAFILGIPKGTTPEDLKTAFAAYHPTTARIVREADVDRKGFAFVTFETEDDQTKAVKDHREGGLKLNGGNSIVRFARPPVRGRGRFFRGGRRPPPARAPRPQPQAPAEGGDGAPPTRPAARRPQRRRPGRGRGGTRTPAAGTGGTPAAGTAPAVTPTPTPQDESQ
jgi:RNA recognition motif-containing protein